METRYRIIRTSGGFVGIVASPRGLRRVFLPEARRSDLASAIRRNFPSAANDDALLPELAGALIDYFSGKPVEFIVRFDWGDCGDFDRDVWQACRAIGYGKTQSYGDLAERVGRPGGARAVGMSMSHNPFPIVIPCHRVVRSDGTLGGYSGPGGVDFKRSLLEMEKAEHGAVT